jgi:hypothetical protein
MRHVIEWWYELLGIIETTVGSRDLSYRPR